MNIAILGANGFIGTRLTEQFHLSKFAAVRPVVRSYNSLIGLSRFNLDFRIADGFDQKALREAFSGIDAVVHCIAGDINTILGTIKPVYLAAQDAGVQRIIYLSSAAVHGPSPVLGTIEESSLDPKQIFPVNNAKVRAEKTLLKLRKKRNVEVVILRPSLVYGPRSTWILKFIHELLNGNAYLLNNGRGICNCLYIDNLVHAIKLAITEEDVDEQAFLIRDAGQITWADFYKPFTEFFGYGLDEIKNIELPQYQVGDIDTVNLEKLMMYKCEYPLPWKKAYMSLNYEPVVNFSEAVNRTLHWLDFVGYSLFRKAVSISQKTQNTN